jgi:hypothetical protein
MQRKLTQVPEQNWEIRLKLTDQPEAGETHFTEEEIRKVFDSVSLDAGISLKIESVTLVRECRMMP